MRITAQAINLMMYRLARLACLLRPAWKIGKLNVLASLNKVVTYLTYLLTYIVDHVNITAL
jgi:hypothetical protein